MCRTRTSSTLRSRSTAWRIRRRWRAAHGRSSSAGRLDYIDHSLNGRIMKHCAEQQVAPEDVIAAQLREIQVTARESGMELDAMIIEPYTEFLRGKQRFTLTSAPPRPVDLTTVSLYKPSDVPNLLNLMAEAG